MKTKRETTVNALSTNVGQDASESSANSMRSYVSNNDADPQLAEDINTLVRDTQQLLEIENVSIPKFRH